jgi:hypothetical protein
VATRENGLTDSLSLSLSPSRTLVTPYYKRIRPGRRTTRAAVPFFAPPCVLSRADPSGLGHAATIYSSVQGPPGVETPTQIVILFDHKTHDLHRARVRISGTRQVAKSTVSRKRLIVSGAFGSPSSTKRQGEHILSTWPRPDDPRPD